MNVLVSCLLVILQLSHGLQTLPVTRPVRTTQLCMTAEDFIAEPVVRFAKLNKHQSWKWSKGLHSLLEQQLRLSLQLCQASEAAVYLQHSHSDTLSETTDDVSGFSGSYRLLGYSSTAYINIGDNVETEETVDTEEDFSVEPLVAFDEELDTEDLPLELLRGKASSHLTDDGRMLLSLRSSIRSSTSQPLGIVVLRKQNKATWKEDTKSIYSLTFVLKTMVHAVEQELYWRRQQAKGDLVEKKRNAMAQKSMSALQALRTFAKLLKKRVAERNDEIGIEMADNIILQAGSLSQSIADYLEHMFLVSADKK